MLKHAGMFEAKPGGILSFNNQTDVELAWRSWLHQETQNRYVCLPVRTKRPFRVMNY